jgi:hypothetical protein
MIKNFKEYIKESYSVEINLIPTEEVYDLNSCNFTSRELKERIEGKIVKITDKSSTTFEKCFHTDTVENLMKGNRNPEKISKYNIIHTNQYMKIKGTDDNYAITYYETPHLFELMKISDVVTVMKVREPVRIITTDDPFGEEDWVKEGIFDRFRRKKTKTNVLNVGDKVKLQGTIPGTQYCIDGYEGVIQIINKSLVDDEFDDYHIFVTDLNASFYLNLENIIIKDKIEEETEDEKDVEF